MGRTHTAAGRIGAIDRTRLADGFESAEVVVAGSATLEFTLFKRAPPR